MRSKRIAVLLSDMHLSQTAPVARSAEPNWFDTIRRQWKPISETARKHDIPIVIAGDIFDRWNVSPEVINLAIELFTDLEIFAIPGQHDLPNHNYDQMHRSAYGVLTKSHVIENLPPKQYIEIIFNDSRMGKDNNLILYGYPWGYEPRPIKPRPSNSIHLAVVHKYLWIDGVGYPGAPEETRLTKNTVKMLQGYHAAVIGDNHQHFHDKHIFNCGGFIPRKSDERHYTPCYGVLWSDSRITKHLLPTETDKWISTFNHKEIAKQNNLTDFVGMLESLGGEQLEFTSTVKLYLDKNRVTGRVKELVLEVLEKDEST